MSAQLCQEAAGEFRVDNRIDLRQEPTKHEHQFTPVWQNDGTLVDWCSCGQERECDVSLLFFTTGNFIGLLTDSTAMLRTRIKTKK